MLWCDWWMRILWQSLCKLSLFPLGFLLTTQHLIYSLSLCQLSLVTLMLVTNHLKPNSYLCGSWAISHHASILCLMQKRYPRCVCWIDLSHCQHLSELLVVTLFANVCCVPYRCPSSHPGPLAGGWQQVLRFFFFFLRFGFNFKLGWQAGLSSNEKRIPLPFPAFLTLKPSSYTHPPIQNFLVQKVIWATGKGTNSEFSIFIPVCNQWEHAVMERENYGWIKAN